MAKKTPEEIAAIQLAKAVEAGAKATAKAVANGEKAVAATIKAMKADVVKKIKEHFGGRITDAKDTGNKTKVNDLKAMLAQLLGEVK